MTITDNTTEQLAQPTMEMRVRVPASGPARVARRPHHPVNDGLAAPGAPALPRPRTIDEDEFQSHLNHAPRMAGPSRPELVRALAKRILRPTVALRHAG